VAATPHWKKELHTADCLDFSQFVFNVLHLTKNGTTGILVGIFHSRVLVDSRTNNQQNTVPPETNRF
jgi:hypothetical protein